MTPKLIWVMRQQLGEWTEVDEKEQAMVEREAMSDREAVVEHEAVVEREAMVEREAVIEREAVVREQKREEEVEKETYEAVHQKGSTEKESESGMASIHNISSERVSKAGTEENSLKKEKKKKRRRCHRREMEAQVKEEGELSKEEGELDSSDEEVTSLVRPSSSQGKSKRLSTKRVFTLGLS